MNQILLEKYVKLIIKKGVNIQPDQKLYIECPVNSAWFAHTLSKEAYEAGSGEVFVHWYDDEGEQLRYKYAPDNIFGCYPEWNKLKLDTLCKEKAAFIFIISSDPNLLMCIPEERIERDSQSAQLALQYYDASLMSNKSQWCVLPIPSEPWARLVFPDLNGERAVEKMWEVIFSVTYIDHNDPIDNWNIHIETLFRQQDILNKYNLKALIYKNSLGTDLMLELVKRHIWLGGKERTLVDNIEFIANIPTEEIFTTPKRNSATGIVYITKPLVYRGKVIEDIVIEFKKGKVVNLYAKKNESFLKKIIFNTPGLDCLGEVALVSHDSPISKSGILFYNGLFDENAACHLALGKAYTSTVKDTGNKSDEELIQMGINCAMDHIDIMIGSEDLNIMGITYNGQTIPVLVNGKIVL